MALSRHRDIPWLRIAAEGSAIVASILLAFAIDAWWDKRGDQIRERAMLTEMRAEFAQAESRILFLLSQHRSALDAFTQMQAILNSDDPGRHEQEFDEYSRKLWTTDPYVADMPVYENLLATTGLDFVSNETIRQNLRAYESVATRNRDLDEYLVKIDAGIGLETLMSRVPAPVSIQIDGIAEIPAELGPGAANLATDLAFRNLLVVRVFGEGVLIERRTALLDAVRAVQVAIEDAHGLPESKIRAD